MESIEKGGETLALILRRDVVSEGTKFFTPSENPLQLGILNHPPGHVIAAHTHRPIEKTVGETQEVLVVQHGRVEVEFFTTAGERVATRTLATGDVILLLRGGHGFRFLEPTRLVEVKQGPYSGREVEKRMLPG